VGLEVVVGVLGLSDVLSDAGVAGFSACSFFKASLSSCSFSICALRAAIWPQKG